MQWKREREFIEEKEWKELRDKTKYRTQWKREREGKGQEKNKEEMGGHDGEWISWKEKGVN